MIVCPRCGHSGLKAMSEEAQVSKIPWYQRIFGGNKVRIVLTGVAVVCLKCGYAFMATTNLPYESVFANNATPESRKSPIGAPGRNSPPLQRSNIPDPDLDLGQTP